MGFTLADLARSGLDESDLKRLQFRPLDADETSKITGGKFNSKSYVIPYFNKDGANTGFFRLRLDTNEQKPSGFNRQKNNKEPQRYWQPPNTLPRLYLPPGQPWADIMPHPKTRLVITEGEKKAVAGCKKGLTVIGLGGVWNFKSGKAGVSLIPDLKQITWKGREVEICFDSDAGNRSDLMGALYALANELILLGADVIYVTLPASPKGEKWGLDDFLVMNSVDDYLALPRERFDLSRELFRIQDEYGYLKDPPGHIIRLKDSKIMQAQYFFLDVNNRIITKVNADGKLVKIPAGPEWLRWEQRREISHVIYEPRHPGEQIQRGDGTHNLWTGWGAEPVEGDATLFIEWLTHVVLNAHERDLLISYFAYPVQHPGTKVGWAPLLWSEMQGSGKTMIGELIAQVYGSAGDDDNGEGNAIELKTLEELFSRFNNWAYRRQFVTVEETHVGDNRQQINRLKGMITGRHNQIERKFVDQFMIRDRINFYFTSQHENAVYLEKHDRRFMVIHANEQKPPRQLVDRVSRWKNSGRAAPAIHHYLQTYKINPTVKPGEAPGTTAKKEMIREGWSSIDEHCERIMATELRPTPPTELQNPWPWAQRQLTTSREVAKNYEEKYGAKISTVTAGRSLRKAGAIYAGQRRDGSVTQVDIGGGERDRIFAIHDLERWRWATQAELAKQFMDERRLLSDGRDGKKQ